MSKAMPAPSAIETGRIGEPLRRREDAKLLTGCGTFSDDCTAAGKAHAVVLR